jgi:2-polyprenyl-6-methoxyphenol hydroxylase-like FAD-dependent oxidoreductase
MGFRIIIVGGGIAGLSLANMLERFNIDYVLLEAYPQIVPQAGAGLALLPNGFRILDQLGCFEPVLDLAGDCRSVKVCLRRPGGAMIDGCFELPLSYHLKQTLEEP